MARRSQHTPQQLRDMIIEAAQRLIESGGVAQLSAREVAKMIGYAPGTLYNVFENLDDIVLRVEVKMLEELDGTLETAMDGQVGRNAVLSFARAYLMFALDRMRLWRLINDHRPASFDTLPEWYSERFQTILARLQPPLASMLPGAEPAETVQAARALWGAIHGIASCSTCSKIGFASAEAAFGQMEHMLQLYLDGLQARAGAKSGLRNASCGQEHAA